MNHWSAFIRKIGQAFHRTGCERGVRDVEYVEGLCRMALADGMGAEKVEHPDRLTLFVSTWGGTWKSYLSLS